MKKIILSIFMFLTLINISFASGNIEIDIKPSNAESYVLPEIEVKDSNLKSRCEKILQKTYLLEKRESELKKNNTNPNPAERLSVVSKLAAYYDALLIFGCDYGPED